MLALLYFERSQSFTFDSQKREENEIGGNKRFCFIFCYYYYFCLFCCTKKIVIEHYVIYLFYSNKNDVMSNQIQISSKIVLNTLMLFREKSFCVWDYSSVILEELD